MKLTVLLLLIASTLSAAAANNEKVEELKARIATKDADDRVKLFTEIAELQLKQLSKAYDEGNSVEAEAALQDVVDYGLKAAESSQEHRKRMKQTEITIRKISNRLDDISRTLSFDERQSVTSAIKKLDAARSDLLHAMFKKR